MPVREKPPTSAGSRPARPFSRPSHTQTAAKVRGFSPTAPGFTAEIDSALEGDGFEPSVPRQKDVCKHRDRRGSRAAGTQIDRKMAKMPICTVA
jgi:hypothetical protein